MNILRTCTITVTYLRGIDNGKLGFWRLDQCAAEKLDSCSFLYAAELPSAESMLTYISTYNDTTGEGISRHGATAKLLHRDGDRAKFEVTANVVKP